MAQRLDPEGVAVVGMMQLEVRAAAVQALVAHLDEAELDQAAGDLADGETVRVAPLVPSPNRPHLLGVALRPLAGLLAVSRAVGGVPLPGSGAIVFGVGGVAVAVVSPQLLDVGSAPRSAASSALLGMLRPVLSVVGAAALLAVGAAPPGAVVQVELHQMLLPSALRADLRQRMIRVGCPFHGRYSLGG